MIEVIVLNYLIRSFPKVSIGFEKKSEASQIIIDITANNCTNGLWSATFAIQSYAESKAKAAKLSYQVIDKMLNIANVCDEISDCSINSNYDFTDTSTKEYRYQSVFDLHYYR